MNAVADLFPLPTGLVAITGDEGAGKTTLLRRLGGDLPALPDQPPGLDAFWLDLALPERDEQTPQQVWEALRPQCPRWNLQLQHDVEQALELDGHQGKKLFMLSTGSRRKVALVALLASGATVTCLDQPFAALDAGSARVVREFLGDMADHKSRTWVVADYAADARLRWKLEVALG
jgi:ABC-type multidrug transport system ATPase subunit